MGSAIQHSSVEHNSPGDGELVHEINTHTKIYDIKFFSPIFIHRFISLPVVN